MDSASIAELPVIKDTANLMIDIKVFPPRAKTTALIDPLLFDIQL